MGNLKKYNEVKPVSHAGYSFASKAEAALFDLLTLRLRANEIDAIKPQDRVRVCCGKLCSHNSKIEAIIDFRCKRVDPKDFKEMYFWAECKGFETEKWLLKRRLWMHYGPGPLEIWKINRKGLYLDETIIPEHALESSSV